MRQKALRDNNDIPVFVKENGEYSYSFPENQIVEQSTIGERYRVYFFIPDKKETFIELSVLFQEKERALDFATEIYGYENFDLKCGLSGEVFEVEVHRV